MVLPAAELEALILLATAEVVPVRGEALYPGAAVPPDELARGEARLPDEFALDGVQFGDELAPDAVRSRVEGSPVVADSLGEACFAHEVGSPSGVHSAVPKRWEDAVLLDELLGWHLEVLQGEVRCYRVDCFLALQLGWRLVVERVHVRWQGCKALRRGWPSRHRSR